MSGILASSKGALNGSRMILEKLDESLGTNLDFYLYATTRCDDPIVHDLIGAEQFSFQMILNGSGWLARLQAANVIIMEVFPTIGGPKIPPAWLLA